jgi:FkbM family methyltransferase
VGSARARARAGAALKRAGERIGLEVRRHRPAGARRADLLAERGVELVIDVGANQGQYAAQLRRYGYRGAIISFEPLSGPYAALRRRAAADERWEVRRLALSDGDHDIELGVAGIFGSALPTGPHLAALFPEAVPMAHERVPAARLDDLALELPAAGVTLLKLDVQGYELRVLAGATRTLAGVDVIEAELSVAALYDGQPRLGEVLRALEDEGFALHALEPTLRDYRTGEQLQYDGLFVRAS